MRLTKRPNSPNWFLETKIRGRMYVRSTKTDHKPTAKKIAEGLLRSIQIEVAQGTSKKITLKDACHRYMTIRKGTPSERSLKGVMTIVLKVLDERTLLSELTGKHYSDYVEYRKQQGCAPQTIKHGVRFISAVVKQAKREGYNVADIEPPVISIRPTRLRYLTLEEEQRLLKELDPLRKGKSIPRQNISDVFTMPRDQQQARFEEEIYFGDADVQAQMANEKKFKNIFSSINFYSDFVFWVPILALTLMIFIKYSALSRAIGTLIFLLN